MHQSEYLSVYEGDDIPISLTKMSGVLADRPDPPYNARIVSCSPTVAEVAWRPGPDNNDPILEYMVFYNLTLFDGERDPPPPVSGGSATRYRDGPRTERDQLLVRVRLVPGASYSFHVRARNGVGLSERSLLTRTQCRTPPTVPFRNPSAVCTDSQHSNQLKIVWQASSFVRMHVMISSHCGERVGLMISAIMPINWVHCFSSVNVLPYLLYISSS